MPECLEIKIRKMLCESKYLIHFSFVKQTKKKVRNPSLLLTSYSFTYPYKA